MIHGHLPRRIPKRPQKSPLYIFFNSRWPRPCTAIYEKTGVYHNSSLLQLNKNILVPLHIYTKAQKAYQQDQKWYHSFSYLHKSKMATIMWSVTPLRKSLTCHNHHVVETFFSEPWNLEYISITNFFNRMCLSTQNPTWLPYWLALLAQVPRLSDVQLLFHMGI